jgi:hypothetical protein
MDSARSAFSSTEGSSCLWTKHNISYRFLTLIIHTDLNCQNLPSWKPWHCINQLIMFHRKWKYRFLVKCSYKFVWISTRSVFTYVVYASMYNRCQLARLTCLFNKSIPVPSKSQRPHSCILYENSHNSMQQYTPVKYIELSNYFNVNWY